MNFESLSHSKTVIQTYYLPPPGPAGFSRAPPSSKPRYVAWAGSISSTPGCIELPAGLSSVLHLPAGTEVSVELLPDLAAAAAVVVEPVGTADWEVVELNAEQLEDKLLNQVRSKNLLCSEVASLYTLPA